MLRNGDGRMAGTMTLGQSNLLRHRTLRSRNVLAELRRLPLDQVSRAVTARFGSESAAGAAIRARLDEAETVAQRLVEDYGFDVSEARRIAVGPVAADPFQGGRAPLNIDIHRDVQGIMRANLVRGTDGRLQPRFPQWTAEMRRFERLYGLPFWLPASAWEWLWRRFEADEAAKPPGERRTFSDWRALWKAYAVTEERIEAKARTLARDYVAVTVCAVVWTGVRAHEVTHART